MGDQTKHEGIEGEGLYVWLKESGNTWKSLYDYSITDLHFMLLFHIIFCSILLCYE